MKHLYLILIIALFSCKSDDEATPAVVVDDDPIEINQICLSKAYYYNLGEDSIVFPGKCFTVDSMEVVGVKNAIFFHDVDSIYSALPFYTIGMDTSTVRGDGIIVNNMYVINKNSGKRNWSSQQCTTGSVIITKDSANMVSGIFEGSGYVSRQDTLFVVKGYFTNVVY